MGLLEGLLYMLWRGVAIGVIISAPMGPVGILCVQRTLEKGRRTGFYTGVGAALSDLFYCLLTGFGLSFIEEFLEKNSNIIQLVGSLVLIGFGIYLFKSNPSKKLKRPSDNGIPAGKNILSGFLFTFSNPLIIFLIIGLFARFNFLLPEIMFYHYILGFIAIIAGALMWWWVVTFFVDKVRAHFNLRSMWLINKIIGSVILMFAVVGIFNAVTGLANAAESVSPQELCPKIIKLSNHNSGSVVKWIDLNGFNNFDLKFRIRNINNSERKRYEFTDSTGKSGYSCYPGWRIIFGDEIRSPFVSVKTDSNPFDEVTDQPTISFSLRKGQTLLSNQVFTSGLNIFEGLNAYRIRVKNGELTLWGGNRVYDTVFFGVRLDTIPDKIGFAVEPGGEIWIEHVDLKNIGVDNLKGSNSSDGLCLPVIELLKEKLSHSKDRIEGLWGLLDYSVDDTYLKLGGEYTVAIIGNSGRGDTMEYDVYYVSGAEKYSDSWEYGAVKGVLKPTAFPDLFNMKWISANGDKIKKSIKVEFDTPDMIISIPEYSSTIRFRKIYPVQAE